MSDTEMLNFVPLVGVGQYRYGESIEDWIKDGHLELSAFGRSKEDGGRYRDQNGTVSIVVDHEKRIQEVLCDVEFFCKGRNLIGMSIAEASELLGQQPDDYEEPYELPDDTVEAMAFFYSLGLTVGLLNNKDGPITIAITNADDDDFSDEA